MEVASLWNLPKVHGEAQEEEAEEVHVVSILAEVRHLDQAVASIVGLMVTGLETAKMGTGKTSVIAVVREVT